jgi:hypothetical protein
MTGNGGFSIIHSNPHTGKVDIWGGGKNLTFLYRVNALNYLWQKFPDQAWKKPPFFKQTQTNEQYMFFNKLQDLGVEYKYGSGRVLGTIPQPSNNQKKK